MNNINKKGSLCSFEGKKYELQIYNIVSKCELNNKKFNTQDEKYLKLIGPLITKYVDRLKP